jgi:hypothetical protein
MTFRSQVIAYWILKLLILTSMVMIIKGLIENNYLSGLQTHLGVLL